jgi:hypothetical protein
VRRRSDFLGWSVISLSGASGLGENIVTLGLGPGELVPPPPPPPPTPSPTPQLFATVTKLGGGGGSWARWDAWWEQCELERLEWEECERQRVEAESKKRRHWVVDANYAESLSYPYRTQPESRGAGFGAVPSPAPASGAPGAALGIAAFAAVVGVALAAAATAHPQVEPQRKTRSGPYPQSFRKVAVKPLTPLWANSADELEYPEHALIQEKFIKCGKADCTACPHGPYLYAKWFEDGRSVSKYLGKA